MSCDIGSMYDVDGNGWIDLEEMTRIVVSIYKMMGDGAGPGGAEVREIKSVRRHFVWMFEFRSGRRGYSSGWTSTMTGG